MRLERLSPERHAPDLHRAYSASPERLWAFLPYGPFETPGAYLSWTEARAGGDDPRFYAICTEADGAAAGLASYLRINGDHGVIEIGHIALSAALQGTVAATEALSSMIAWAFEAGYRRVEWKCDAANRASRRAAQRLGFSFEGVFRQAAIVKGRNRDTAWFAIIDADWPGLRACHEKWLAPENFDDDGQQKTRLSDLTAPRLFARDPTV